MDETMVNGWKIGYFKDVLEPVSRPVAIKPDKTYRTLGVQWYAKGLFVREDKPGYDIRAKELYRVEKGDFVYNRLFAWKGSFGIVDADTEGGVVSGEFPYFRVKTEYADAKFLHYYLSQEWVWDEVGRNSSGQTNISRLRLKEKDFLAMEIPLPPLDEQRHIVARIEALAGRIAEARSLRQSATEETDVLISSFAKREFRNNPWKKISVDNFVGRKNLKNGKSLKSNEQSSLVSCLRISSLRNGVIDCSDVKPINMSLEDAQPYRVHPGDVFIVRGNGSKDLVGRAGMIKQCEGAIIFPDLFIRVPLDTKQILPEFFVTWWNSPEMRNLIVDLAKTTSGIWKVNQGHIGSCKVPIPPLDEQRRIVAYLDSLSERVNVLRRLQAESQVELDALLPSVLDRAFKGEL